MFKVDLCKAVFDLMSTLCAEHFLNFFQNFIFSFEKKCGSWLGFTLIIQSQLVWIQTVFIYPTNPY